MTHILLADDDKELTELLTEYLNNHGITCDSVHDGEAVLARLQASQSIAQSQKGPAQHPPYDLLVLDIMMPKMDGLGVLRHLPTLPNTQALPVIMLTAKGDEIDRIIGLELGADDYISKPCNPRELLARINAVIKRSNQTMTETIPLIHNRLHLDTVHRLATIDEEPLQLTGTEFDLLVALLQQKGNVVSKEVLSETVLQRELQPFDRSLDVHISRLRKKLLPYSEESIKSVRGKGYQLVI